MSDIDEFLRKTSQEILNSTREEIVDAIKEDAKDIEETMSKEDIAKKYAEKKAQLIAFSTSLDEYFASLERVLSISNALPENGFTPTEELLLVVHKTLLLHTVGTKLAACAVGDNDFKEYCSNVDILSSQISEYLIMYGELKGAFPPMTEEEKNTWN